MARPTGRERKDGMSIKGFIELHDFYTHTPFIVNVSAIESVGDRFIIYAQSGHAVDEHYDEFLGLERIFHGKGSWLCMCST